MSVESFVPPTGGTLVKTVLDYFSENRSNAYYYTKPMPNLGECFERFLPPEEFAMYGFLNKMRLEKHGEPFPVYLDPYAAMLGQRKDHVLESIKGWYKEETDYITSTQELTDTDLGIPFLASQEKSVTTPVMGRPREHVYISLFCAQAYAMRTKSAKGEQTRSLFIHLAEIAGIYETEQTQRSKAALTLKAKSDQILENFPDGQKVFYTGYAGLLKGRGETEPTPKGKVGFTDVSLTDRYRAHVQEYGDFWLTSAIPMAYPAELEKNVKQSRVFRNSQIDVPYGDEGKCWSELFDVKKVTMDQMMKHAKKLSKDMTSLGGGSSTQSTELALSQLGLERDREKTKQAEAETRKVEAEQKTKQEEAKAQVETARAKVRQLEIELEMMKLRQISEAPEPRLSTPNVNGEGPGVREATREYTESSDIFRVWWAQGLTEQDGSRVTLEEIYLKFREWVLKEYSGETWAKDFGKWDRRSSKGGKGTKPFVGSVEVGVKLRGLGVAITTVKKNGKGAVGVYGLEFS